MVEISGYIIANAGWSEEIKLKMGAATFGTTPAEAWRRHIGYDRWTSLDRPMLIQGWSDRGWRPHPVTLRLENNC